jgi:diguanylate cyclase (GGDEF)-like protein
MNPDVLDKVLKCDRLPSLPAVAARVIELTHSETVSFKDLAETIQNDQALAAKILRTVNSSLFGLRKKCSSINQAIVMLGLSAVKSLALGFSLVGAIKDCDPEGLDMSAHWRRALYTGVAAKQIAAKAGIGNQEECFLGGLLQDVGMIALHQAIGAEYDRVIALAGSDHRGVSKLELDAFQVQHADVGALLAQRWKLPEELVMPIKYHEKPTAAPSEYSAICRAVGLGNIAAELLDATEPAPTLRRFYDKASQWFAIDEGTADEVLRAITVAAREVARFLAVPAGSAPDTEAILAIAREQLATMTIPADDTPDELPAQLSDADVPSRDELTGVSSRARFDQTLIAAFEQAKSARTPLGVAVFEIDQLLKITGEIGRDSGDNVLVVIAGRLDRVLRNAQTLVARYDENRIAVVMPRTSRVDAVRACEAARLAVAGSPVRLVTAPYGAPPNVEVTVSVGLAVVDTGTIERFEDVSSLLMIVEQAVKAAKKAGCNAIRVYAPTVAAPAA